MILVTLGTQKEQFTRLLEAIEKCNIDDKIIAQIGHTKFESKKIQIIDFVNYEDMNKLIYDADLIITHGGTGSILTPLKERKKVIASARLKKYGEHIDDHQEEIVSIFAKEGYILEYKDGDNLEDIIKKSNDFIPKKYISNTEIFKNNLIKEIDGI